MMRHFKTAVVLKEEEEGKACSFLAEKTLIDVARRERGEISKGKARGENKAKERG